MGVRYTVLLLSSSGISNDMDASFARTKPTTYDKILLELSLYVREI